VRPKRERTEAERVESERTARERGEHVAKLAQDQRTADNLAKAAADIAKSAAAQREVMEKQARQARSTSRPAL
jgi:hypothetical protein